ncbi:hypothetical protein OQA88_6071 [Cercophora sp. LCS_1]
MTKPIRVWLTPPGPNPWKVVFVLEELSIPYEIKAFPFSEVKSKPFTDVNPNGRVPAIEDPNTDITLWESGAIVTYLIEQYDTDKKLTHTTLREKHLENQWLHFQMSGQGPYYGQMGWFNVLHNEHIPSAIERYKNEVLRVLGVLNGVLEGKEWLVGDKMTYADMSFVPWNDRLDDLLRQPLDETYKGLDNVRRWHQKMAERPAWKRAMAIRRGLMIEQGLLDQTGMPEGFNNIQEYMEFLKKGGN